MSALRAFFTVLGCTLASCALCACGGDDKPAPSGRNIDDIRGDAGGDTQDAAEPPEQTKPEDRDHVLESDEQVLCGYDDEDVSTFAAHSSLVSLAAASDERGFALLRYGSDGALLIDALGVGEPPDAPVRLARADQATETPLIAAAGERFFMLHRQGNALVARLLREDREPRKLSSALSELPGEGLPYALAAQPEHFLVAFLEGETRSLLVQAFDLEGEPLADATELRQETNANHVALARLDSGRTLLAVHELEQDRGVVRAQVLDRDLDPIGSERVLSKRSVDSPRFSLAARALSAGLVHARLEAGTREALEYQRIEPSGEALDAALALVHAPGRGRDASITDFGQGYAIVYRALPSLGMPGSVIKVAFINQFGLVVHEATLAETAADPSDTVISATRDGHVLIAFRSDGGEGAELRVTRMHCPGALVLCGGPVE